MDGTLIDSHPLLDALHDLHTWMYGPARKCHFCEGPIPDDEKAVRAKTGNAWAHFECWYDGTPFKRNPVTGAQL